MSGNPEPIDCLDLTAYQELYRVRFAVWEVETLFALDDAYLSAWHTEEQAVRAERDAVRQQQEQKRAGA